MASSQRACGRAGCSLQGTWTGAEACPACGFPTRQGEEAQHAARKRQLLSTAGAGLEEGETSTSYGLVLLQGATVPHPECAKVDGCKVTRSTAEPLLNDATGVLTCGTAGLAFWADDGVSSRWPYERVVSITVGSTGARVGGGFSGMGVGLGAVAAPHFAGFLNKLTTKTVAYSVIDLLMTNGSMRLQTTSAPQAQVEQALGPALRRLTAGG